jgi:hypothetical protein
MISMCFDPFTPVVLAVQAVTPIFSSNQSLVHPNPFQHHPASILLDALASQRSLRALLIPSFFDSSAPLQMHETFAKSPVLAQFTFSPTVFSILNRILPELAPDSRLYDLDKAAIATSSQPKVMGSMWRHVLAMHLRTGDTWAEFCDERARSTA